MKSYQKRIPLFPSSILRKMGNVRSRTKEPLDEGERGQWKKWFKTQYSKNKDQRHNTEVEQDSWKEE